MKLLTDPLILQPDRALDLSVDSAETPDSVDSLLQVINAQESVIDKKSVVIAEQKKRIGILEE